MRKIMEVFEELEKNDPELKREYELVTIRNQFVDAILEYKKTNNLNYNQLADVFGVKGKWGKPSSIIAFIQGNLMLPIDVIIRMMDSIGIKILLVSKSQENKENERRKEMEDNLIKLERKENKKEETLVDDISKKEIYNKLIKDTIVFNECNGRPLKKGDIIIAILTNGNRKILGSIIKVVKKNGSIIAINVKFPTLNEKYIIEIHYGKIYILDLEDCEEIDKSSILSGVKFFIYEDEIINADGTLVECFSPLFSSAERLSFEFNNHLKRANIDGNDYYISISPNGLKIKLWREFNDTVMKLTLDIDDVEDYIENGSLSFIDDKLTINSY